MRSLKSLSLFIISLMLFSGCFTRTANNPEANVTLKVGYIPIVDCLPLYVAKEKGFFEKQGVRVEIIPLQGGPRVIEAVNSNDINIGYANVVSSIIANSKGIALTGITGGPIESESRQAHALMVSENSAIKGPRDLTGKTVAVNALRNIEYVILQQYLEKNGVDVKSVKIVEAPFPQMEGILKNGSADAVMAVEPFVTLALVHKSARVLGRPYTEVRRRNIVANYVVRNEWLEQNAESAQKFQNALVEANSFIAHNDTEARQILSKYTQMDPSILNQVVLPESVNNFEATDLQAWIDELVRQGIIEKALQADSMLKK